MKASFWLTATSVTDEHVLTNIEYEIEPAGETVAPASATRISNSRWNKPRPVSPSSKPSNGTIKS
jgi:hypothetical protein